MNNAENFLLELGRNLPESERVMVGYAKEATVQVDQNGKKANSGWWPLPYKPGKWIPGNSNCYVCISSSIRTPNPKTGVLRYWRGEACFGHGLALMVDDIGTGRGSKGGLTVEALNAILPPTAVVETSPENFQLWYFLDQPEPHMPTFKAFIRGFVDHVLKAGGDNTIKDVSRYGRMPCGINNKRLGMDGAYKYPVDPSEPMGACWEVVLRYFNPARRYAMNDIASAFGYRVVVPAQRAPAVIDVDDMRMEQRWLDLAVKVCTEAKMGEGGGGVVQMNMSGKYRIACPWGHEHSNGDPFGAYFRGPIPGADVDFVFGCGHDTCRKDNKRTWNAFVDEIVLPLLVDRCNSANEYWSDKDFIPRRSKS
jgi:hypothetical protein